MTGRKALITGGAGHLGGVAADALAELGASVSLLDIEPEACQAKIENLAEYDSIPGIAVPCDLLDERSTRGAIKLATNYMGGLDIIVHCAAYVGTTEVSGWTVPLAEQTVSAWDAALRVNLTAAFVMAQEAREIMETSGNGSMIFFGSTYGLVAPDFRIYEGTDMVSPAGYASSKGGILQLTRYLASAMAPKIRVNSITPGGVWRDQPESFHENYKSRTPLGRMATEQDLKGAVAYLASDMSEYVTGHNLVVDGGWTAW